MSTTALRSLPGFDQTVPLPRDPYRYLGRMRRRLRAETLSGRLVLEPTLFLVGAEGASQLYDPFRVRRTALPEPLRATLTGKGAVQTLDGPRHLARKAALMAHTGAAAAADLRDRFVAQRAAEPPGRPLYATLHRLLTRAALDWAGVPVTEAELPRRARQIALLFDQAGGPNHLGARVARRRLEAWLGGLIAALRSGDAAAPPAPPPT